MSFNAIENAIVGTLFGFFIQKGRVYEPKVIQDQFLFKDFTMTQMFLAAAGTSSLVLGVSSLMPGYWGNHVRNARLGYQKRQCDRGVLSAAMGAGLLGAGMGISGACPGTLYAQIGAASPGWWLIVSGGILGTLVYYVIEKPIKKYLYPRFNFPEHLKDSHIIGSYAFSAISLSAVLWSASLALYKYAPSSTSVVTATSSNIFMAPSWPAPVSGLLVGLLQIPSLHLLNIPLGMSSAFIGFVAPFYQLLHSLNLVPKDSELASWKLKTSLSKLSSIIFVVGGSFLSAYISGTFLNVPGLLSETSPMNVTGPMVIGNGYMQALLGGFLLLLGARVGGGCTSGHGLSGFAFLGLNSLVAVPSMFAGAIAAAWALKAVVGA